MFTKLLRPLDPMCCLQSPQPDPCEQRDGRMEGWEREEGLKRMEEWKKTEGFKIMEEWKREEGLKKMEEWKREEGLKRMEG